MNKKKIFNDPVYGFITIPYTIIFDLIEHPFFQRLRRIKQVGLTHYVYPGALHTRFNHALGAMHLMVQAIEVLRSKEIEITEEEAIAVCIAILLHDIGHGPFSHALEHTLVDIHHEELSLLFMEELNEQFDHQLDLAIQIFKDDYKKKFLYQLVSGQLDMDRMDYLNRDSFFTGVSEGVIGYHRIIKMLSVRNNELVVEEKGIYSIEKFLIARRLMYWQVYLHKTSLVAEQMLIKVLKRAKELARAGVSLDCSKALKKFLYTPFGSSEFKDNRPALLTEFARLDDFDIISALKSWRDEEDFVLSYLSKSIMDRKLFRVELNNEPFKSDYKENLRLKLMKALGTKKIDPNYLFFEGIETNSTYSTAKNEILILFKNGEVKPMSAFADHGIYSGIITKYYLCYPKNFS
ncbi:MAG: HD superfamily phosphohydrolase [Saprospiraceae bacterium]|jgi:HD superfamily phosphohydrolase